MSTSDLTIIYMTANQHPASFAEYQLDVLLKAAGDYPIISVGRDHNRIYNIYDDEPKSHLNMYRQLVKAAKLATTPFIAMAEDDALYPPHHFREFRPGLNQVSYDRHRWSLFTWTDMYNVKDRISNCTMIAGREYYIEAWEERFAKYPGDTMPPHRVSEIGRNNQEEWMGVSLRNRVDWWCTEPTIHINHDNGTDSLARKKRMGRFRAYDIPTWGKATDIIERYK